MNTFRVRIDQLQPSAPYLSRARLDTIMSNTAFILKPVAVKERHGRLCIIEGHERLLALQTLGLSEVEVYLDDSPPDPALLETCIELCEKQGIASILDMEDRLVSLSGYLQLWIERKREMRRELQQSSMTA
ncbi:MAG TPA: ParB N-terminal domain-containing protein [Candidatus Rifleibacterium sp.]|nr:ParB N-terminal domain-containing protein [Candidatus Rifleibacterium sp.]HPT47597.1 ParB N-terminal domain-containing protein [Candidatus Rifleibacterium sp.]